MFGSITSSLAPLTTAVARSTLKVWMATPTANATTILTVLLHILGTPASNVVKVPPRNSPSSLPADMPRCSRRSPVFFWLVVCSKSSGTR